MITKIKPKSRKYYVYMLECADQTLYIGYTTDLENRVLAHNNLKTGAKYTKARRPVKLVYSEKLKTLSSALKREFVLKQMTRLEKLKLIKNPPSHRNATA
jgi:putative endonuclease